MEIPIILKILIALVSVLGPIAAYKLNSIRSKQTQAELINQFENALENKNKYSTCELFSLIYGINMDYKDIRKLIERDDLNSVLYYISKSPEMVTFRNGELKYNTIFEKPWYRKFDKFITNGLIIGITVITIVLMLILVFTDSKNIIFTLALLVITSILFIFQLREKLNDDKIRNKIKLELKASD